jgi:lipopolysaccharide export system protein LptA
MARARFVGPIVVLAVTAATGLLAADPGANHAAGDKHRDDEALSMQAEHLDVDIDAKRAVLTGNVKLTKGAITVAAPRVDVRYDEMPHVTWLKGSGGVVAEVKGVRAEAPEVELDLAQQTLELRGGVRLTRGGGWLSADGATIHIATSKVTMIGVRGSIPVGSAAPLPDKPPP